MAVVNGVVGNDTHRPLNVKEFRGFALVDRYAPLIFVNGKDAKSAQMFTLVHALAHIWLGKAGISGYDYLQPEGTKTETWCDQVAAEFLVPAKEFIAFLERSNESRSNWVTSASRFFKVSPIVIARRALDLNFIKHEEFLELYQRHINHNPQSSKTSSGGDFYNTQKARVGKLLAAHVLRAALEGQIGYREAYEVTGLTDKNLQRYAEIRNIRLNK